MPDCEYKDDPSWIECGGEVKVRPAMTAYVYEGPENAPEDPNRDFAACENHYTAYLEYWDEMWKEYWSNIL